jgi:hypothetical protein
MKKVIVVIISVIAMIMLFLFAYEHKSKQEQLFSDYSLTPSEDSLIHDGDIILRYGYGIISDIIVEQLNEPYSLSHCGIVCRNDSSIVIHSVSSSISPFDGVQCQSLKSFVKDSKKNSVIVVRFKSPDERKSLSAISKRAYYYLDKKVPFDHKFDISDSSKIYCSELIYLIIKDEFGFDIFKDKIKSKLDHFRYATFLDTAHFSIILNHQPRIKKK